mgnify:CR=1 FL=1
MNSHSFLNGGVPFQLKRIRNTDEYVVHSLRYGNNYVNFTDKKMSVWSGSEVYKNQDLEGTIFNGECELGFVEYDGSDISLKANKLNILKTSVNTSKVKNGDLAFVEEGHHAGVYRVLDTIVAKRGQAPPPGAVPDTSKAVPPDEDVECPGPNSPRIGDVAQNKTEKVSGFELSENGKICIVLYEDIGVVEQYLPSAQVATTTAVIASVAASSALLAKPLADLLLRVVKPAVKQVMTKVNAILGKTPYRLTEEEKKTNEYRVKKGLLPIPFAKNHQKKMKAQKKAEQSQKKNR